MGWSGPEFGHSTLERTNAPVSNLDRLSGYQETFQRHPDTITQALQSDPRVSGAMTQILWTEKTSAISEKHPVEKNPDSLSTDPDTREIQQSIYQELGIDVKTDSNWATKKLMKGVIDGLIIGNIELVMKIKEEGIGKFLGQIQDQLSTYEWWVKIAEWLKKSVFDLFSGDAYKTGKSVADLWLVTTGAWAAGWGLKKIGKAAIHSAERIGSETVAKNVASTTLHGTGKILETSGTVLQVPAKVVWKVSEWVGKGIGYVGEKTWVNTALRYGAEKGKDALETAGVSNVVRKTKDAVKWVIWALGAVHIVWSAEGFPRHPKVSEAGAILPEGIHWKKDTSLKQPDSVDVPPTHTDRVDLSHYDNSEKLNGLKQRLDLPETATIEEVERVFRLRLQESMKMYETLGKLNLEKIWQKFMEWLKKHGVENPEAKILEELQKVQAEYMRWEIAIVRVYRHKNEIPEKGFLSPYEIHDAPWNGTKVYGNVREWVDKDLWIHWLDAKYATYVVDKAELAAMEKVYKDANHVSVFQLEDLQGRAGLTFYDTMLFGRTKMASPKDYVLDLKDIHLARALKNLEKEYNLGEFETLRQNSFSNSAPKIREGPDKLGKMEEMYRDMPNFIEVQIFGKVDYPPRSMWIEEMKPHLPDPPKWK